MINRLKVFLLRFFYRLLSALAARKDPLDLPHSVLQVATHDGSIAVRMYNGDAAANKPLIVFLHGGGWMIGDVGTHNALCQRLCQTTGSTVISVDYRLAPEHPFPAAHNDALAVTHWIAQHLSELGPNNGSFILAGDSAGANLATCTCLALDATARELLVGEIVIYPVTDHYSTPYPSYEEKAKGYVLTSSMMRWFWDSYLGDASMSDQPPVTATPLHATNLAELPATLLITAEHDPLRDEGIAYAAKLRDAGVALQYAHYDNAEHGFAGYARPSAEFDQLMKEIEIWLQTVTPQPL